jgi:hypothetical protein
MFCQLISADSPPRLISDIGYFENDRFSFLPLNLSFNSTPSMGTVPHACLSLSCHSDPAIFMTHKQVARAKCHREHNWGGGTMHSTWQSTFGFGVFFFFFFFFL